MIYFALILGNNFVYKFILKKIIWFYEVNEKVNCIEYEMLWMNLINDTSNTFLYILGIFYSLLSCLCYFLFIKIQYLFQEKYWKNN